MIRNIRIGILVAGICALGLALVFGPKNPSFFSFLSPSPAHTTDTPEISTIESKNAPVVEQEEEETQKDAKAPQEVLGTFAEQLQAVRDERVLADEQTAPATLVGLPSQKLYAAASRRVVNLFCELDNNEVAIATGVIIHEGGYILTNAHVADAKNPHSCLIRHGSPARNFAIAKRIFLAPDFSSENHTRENLARDVAIWKITEIIEDEAPPLFSSLAIRSTYVPTDGSKLATFSYPAELLGSQAVVSALHLSFSETRVVAHDAYFIESAQGLGSQKGSSGGILLDPFTGEFAGLIFAINDAKTESVSERTLFSLTTFAINETIRLATGKDLEAYLAGNP